MTHRKFASDAHAKGQCDRCGFVFKLSRLMYQVVDQQLTKLRVCKTCLDVDQEQLQLGKVDATDPQQLRDPRPFKFSQGPYFMQGRASITFGQRGTLT